MLQTYTLGQEIYPTINNTYKAKLFLSSSFFWFFFSFLLKLYNENTFVIEPDSRLWGPEYPTTYRFLISSKFSLLSAYWAAMLFSSGEKELNGRERNKKNLDFPSPLPLVSITWRKRHGGRSCEIRKLKYNNIVGIYPEMRTRDHSTVVPSLSLEVRLELTCKVNSN